MFPMTITINTHEQLNAVLSALGTPGAPNAEPAPTAVQIANAALDAIGKATTAKKQKAEQAPAPAATPEPKAEPAPVADSQASYQDAASAITKLSRIKGREAAVALLGNFGASKLPDVKPEQYGDVIAQTNALMGE